MIETYEDWANEDMPEEDLTLFEDMRGNYISEEEKVFFETLEHREKHEWTTQSELLLSEEDNAEQLYILRICYNEYKVGRFLEPLHKDNTPTPAIEVYTNSLHEALYIQLKEFKMPLADKTMLDWLRENNYKYINYEMNPD